MDEPVKRGRGRPRKYPEIDETKLIKGPMGKIPSTAIAAEEIRDAAAGMVLLALKTLANVCEFSLNDSARVSAAKELLDRAGGKAHVFENAEIKPQTQIKVIFGDPAKQIDG